MSILVSGVEMPKGSGKNLAGLWLFIGSDGLVAMGIGGGKYEVLDATAIEVPPHGRLIDADALDHRIYYDTPLALFGTIKRMASIRDMVADAPTIIEAEE